MRQRVSRRDRMRARRSARPLVPPVFRRCRNSRVPRKSAHTRTPDAFHIPERDTRNRPPRNAVTHARHFETRSRFGKNNTPYYRVQATLGIRRSRLTRDFRCLKRGGESFPPRSARLPPDCSGNVNTRVYLSLLLNYRDFISTVYDVASKSTYIDAYRRRGGRWRGFIKALQQSPLSSVCVRVIHTENICYTRNIQEKAISLITKM